MNIINSIIRFLFRRPYRFIKRHIYKIMVSYLLSVIPVGLGLTTVTTGVSLTNPQSIIQVYKNSGVMNIASAGLLKPIVNGSRVGFGNIIKGLGNTFNNSGLKQYGLEMINIGHNWFNQGQVLSGTTIESGLASGVNKADVNDNSDDWSFNDYPDYYKIVGLSNLNSDDIGNDEYVKYLDKDEQSRIMGVEAVISYNTILSSASSEPKTTNGKKLAVIFDDNTNVQGWDNNFNHLTVRVPWLYGKNSKGLLWQKSMLLPSRLGGTADESNGIVLTQQCNVGGVDDKGGYNYIIHKIETYLSKNQFELVKYVATTQYDEFAIIPKAIIIQIKSRDGELDETVKVYNTANGYTLDYKTGQIIL